MTALALVMCSINAVSAADRTLNPDRPSKTDGPFTLDAGRWQIETEFVTATRDSDEGVETDSTSAGTTYLRYGVTPRFELQVGVQPYAQVSTTAAGASSRIDGFGDTVLRAKYNLWGDDAGATAFTLLPFIKVPTARVGLGNSSYEPGLSLPFTWNLPGDWQLGLMAKVSWLRNQAGSGRHEAFEFSAIMSHSIRGPLSGYVEVWRAQSTESGSSQPSTLGLALTWALSANAQMDAGVNIALNRAADDLAFFSGYTLRL